MLQQLETSKSHDTIGNNVICGEYGEVFKFKDSAIVTQNPIAIKLVDSDSLYIHADTLLATGPAENRILTGYYGVRIYKTNLSGVSDSIHVDQKSGLIQLLRYPIGDRESQLLSASDMTKRNPVLWSGKTQMSGDLIHLLTDSTTNAIDSLKIFNNAVVAEQDSFNPLQFNQMKGIYLLGNFEDNELKTIVIDKNAEMLYYLYDDTTKDLIGIDKAISSAMQLQIENNQIQSISFLTRPDGAVYPIEELPLNEQKLPGFYWRGDEMILSKNYLVIETTKKNQAPSEASKIMADIKQKNKMAKTIRDFFFTHQAQTTAHPIGLEIKKARGSYIIDKNNKKYLDFVAGVSACTLGHCHPKVIRAVRSQMRKYLHVMVYGEFVQNEPVQLVKLLADHLPEKLSCTYLTNSGTEGIEGHLSLRKGQPAGKNYRCQ